MFRPTATKCCVVIPARLASTRLPEKMLLAETGKPLVQHTYEAARRARLPQRVIIATDDERIATAVERFGAEAIMTSTHCQSGTDRCAEIARMLPEMDIIVNVQGDEPELQSASIDRLIELISRDEQHKVATLAAPLRCVDALRNPANVKVVFDGAGRALYFSRSPIPHVRDAATPPVMSEPPVFHQHLGIYAYRRDYLLSLSELPPSPLELLERLEQLRILEAGEEILVGVVPHVSSGIDTPEDYRQFVARQRAARAA